MRLADAVFRFARSVRLTLGIAAVLAALCVVGSAFPTLGLFRTPFFLIPVLLLFLNLLACTLYRFLRELGKQGRRNFAPDILHVALLLFMVAACFSGFLRIDMALRLAEGDTALLPNGSLVTAETLRTEVYADGRPKAWISQITVTSGETDAAGGGAATVLRHELRVNAPLRTNDLTLYQYSWGIAGETEYTVLRVVWDPGMYFVIASLLFVGASVFIVLYTKLLKKV